MSNCSFLQIPALGHPVTFHDLARVLAALVMQLGAEGVFVGSGIFKSQNPSVMAKAVVEATTHFRNPDIIARVSEGLGDPMRGMSVKAMPEEELLAVRGN